MNYSKLTKFIHHQPVVLFGLLIIVILGFTGVASLVSAFSHRQQTLAKDLFQKGESEIQAHQPKLAVVSLRSALAFDPTNYEYELKLAQALADQQHFDEAHAYLINLWDTRPQDSEVNLQLARIAAIHGTRENTLRYYHNAIYGIWSDNADVRHRQARLELVNYLLAQNDLTQARAELIASAAGLPANPELHRQIADLFTHAQDYADALSEYRDALNIDKKNFPAMVGAGKAAFQLGQYRNAQRYFETASQHGKLDDESERILNVAELILENDPTQRGLSDVERARRILKNLGQAHERLLQCAKDHGEDLSPDSPATPMQILQSEWVKLKPALLPRRFRYGTDESRAASDLVFRIEKQTQAECGKPAGIDQALLIIGTQTQGER